MKHNPYTHNAKDQKQLRQSLRNNATSAEAILWRALKGKQVNGLKFRRQFGVGPYVLDFYCPKLNLGIELDGEVHNTEEAYEYDEARTRFLNENKIKVLRFSNDVVFNNTEAIIEAVKDVCSDHP